MKREAIILVDDNRAMLDTLREYLEQQGYDVTSCAGGRSALSVAATGAGMQEVGSLTLHTSAAELDPSDAPAEIGLPGGEYVVLTVRDTGPGRDEESLSRIFDPFHRSLEAGAGLELASVYGFVKQSGGYIWTASAPGKGTTFTVCLPRVVARK